MKLLSLDLMTASLQELREAAAVDLSPTAEQARNMYNGHHLGRPHGQGRNLATDFAYWRGPMVRLPEGGTEAQKREAQAAVNEFQTALERSFTSTNFVKETLTREVASCTAKMSWTVTQVDAQQKVEEQRTDLEQEADALLTSWWRTARRHPEKAIRTALTFARREGRGVLRFRVAGGALSKGEDGQLRVKTTDMAEVARFIRLEHVPTPESVTVWEDPDTFDPSAVYAYKDGNERECAETCHVNGSGLTVLRVHRSSEEQPTEVFTLDLGRRITYLDLQAEPAISLQFLQNQMAFNTASTMILRNTELAGFLERWGINIEPPSEMIDDPARPGQKIKRFAPVRPGAGTMVAWQQSTVRSRDARGNVTDESPLGKAEYGRFEPSSPEALISATTHNMLNMYSEVGQSYVLMGKDATASGRSREVAISDFDNVRGPTIDLAEDTTGEVAETFLALVAALTNRPGYFSRLQVGGQVKTKIVPPSAEDRQADREDVKEKIISRQTARQRQGVDDPADEDAQIQREGKEAAAQAPAPTPDPQEKDLPDPAPEDPPNTPPTPRPVVKPRRSRKVKP